MNESGNTNIEISERDSNSVNTVQNSGTTSKTKKVTKKAKKVKKKKDKRPRTFMGKAFAQKDKPHIALFIFELLICFILDILRIIKNLIVGIFGISLVAAGIVAIILLVKINPIYSEYKAMADKVVKESTEATFRISENSYIYDKDGKLLAKLRADKDSNYLKFEDIPTEVIDAFVAVEDRSFWDNPGIDIKGLIRIGVDAIRTKGEEMHGASTITQQLARNIFLSHEVSIERKAKEMLISLNLTKKYSKRDIMEFYVNDICFANAYYGIESASIGYFNKHANELTLSEMAYLCAIPNSPSYYDPYKNPDRAIKRRDKILGDMLEMEYISQAEYDEALLQEIVITKPESVFNNYETTYAIDCAIKYLMKLNEFEFEYEFKRNSDYVNYNKKYDEAYETAKQQLYSGGYKIYTTIDSTKQAELQEILNKGLSFNKKTNDKTGLYQLQGAMTVIDNGTGKVVAIIGGRTGDIENVSYGLNRAFQSPRQPGSSIKPLIVYGPSLEHGYRQESIVTNIDITAAKEKDADLDKLGGEKMTLRRALELSKNGVAWKLFSELTPEVGMKYITDMEFSRVVPDDYYVAASLGGFTYGATTTEMAGAYATLVNHGEFRQVTCIDRMLDRYGKDIYLEATEKQVYKKRVADEMVDLMQGVITNGTASGLGWTKKTKVEAAAKTGTTNDNKDGWLCGSTPYYTIAVWVGYDIPKEMPSLWGSSYPGQIWRDAMLNMLGDIKVGEFMDTEYTLDDDIEMPDSYYTYLPGRDDSEALASGYTVADYRKDRVIGEGVDKVIKEMKAITGNTEESLRQLEEKRNEAQTIIDTIYSRKYTAEKQSELNSAYDSVIANIGDIAEE